jgi:hypothetical protein
VPVAGRAQPGAGGVLFALLGGALLGLGLGVGERGLDLLEGELQLLVGQPLRARPELHALQLAQQVLQSLDPLRQRVPLGDDTVALGCQGIPRNRSSITLAPGGQEQCPQHRGILWKSLRRFAAATHRPRVYAAAVGLGILLSLCTRA